MTLADGRKFKLEKNHRVEIKPATEVDINADKSDVRLPHTTTVKQLIDHASANDPAFWKYRAASQNCQKFTKDVLERNHLTPEHDPEKYSPQDAKALVDTLPLGETIPNVATDLAERLDAAVRGGAVDLKKWY